MKAAGGHPGSSHEEPDREDGLRLVLLSVRFEKTSTWLCTGQSPAIFRECEEDFRWSRVRGNFGRRFLPRLDRVGIHSKPTL